MYKKEQTFLNTEHRRNLTNLHKRLLNVSSVNQKKKNPQDPYLHPTYLFRPVSPSKKVNDYNSSSHLKSTNLSRSPEFVKTPINTEPYIQFKDDIMDEIVSNRLYKEQDILQVFEKHKTEKQDELDPLYLNQVLIELAQELYIPL